MQHKFPEPVSLFPEIPLSVCTNEARLNALHEACRTLYNEHLPMPHENPNIYGHVLSDDDNQILFCDVPKVGSSTFKRLWLNFTRGVDGRNSIHNREFLRKHNLRYLNSYNKSEIQTRLKTYFKFMTTRHPLLRVLSAYRDKFERPHRYYHQHFGRIIEMKYGHIPDNQSKGDNVTFEQFVHFIIDSVPKGYDHHWRPISILCNPCHISYDYIAKLETSYEDYPHIFAQLKNLTDSKRSALQDMRQYRAVTDFDLVNEYYKSIPSEHMTIFKTIYNLDALLLGYTWESTSMSRGCRIITEGKECC